MKFAALVFIGALATMKLLNHETNNLETAGKDKVICLNDANFSRFIFSIRVKVK